MYTKRESLLDCVPNAGATSGAAEEAAAAAEAEAEAAGVDEAAELLDAAAVDVDTDRTRTGAIDAETQATAERAGATLQASAEGRRAELARTQTPAARSTVRCMLAEGQRGRSGLELSKDASTAAVERCRCRVDSGDALLCKLRRWAQSVRCEQRSPQLLLRASAACVAWL